MNERQETTTPTVYECPDCDWTGTLDDINGLHHLHHIYERISLRRGPQPGPGHADVALG